MEVGSFFRFSCFSDVPVRGSSIHQTASGVRLVSQDYHYQQSIMYFASPTSTSSSDVLCGIHLFEFTIRYAVGLPQPQQVFFKTDRNKFEIDQKFKMFLNMQIIDFCDAGSTCDRGAVVFFQFVSFLAISVKD